MVALNNTQVCPALVVLWHSQCFADATRLFNTWVTFRQSWNVSTNPHACKESAFRVENYHRDVCSINKRVLITCIANKNEKIQLKVASELCKLRGRWQRNRIFAETNPPLRQALKASRVIDILTRSSFAPNSRTININTSLLTLMEITYRQKPLQRGGALNSLKTNLFTKSNQIFIILAVLRRSV